MEDYAIGQSILVQPDFSFQQIASTLEKLGWQWTGDDDEEFASSLVRDEPEFSSWTWQGQKPILIYSFNPIAKLRVLDVATLPPALRGQLAQHLPLLQDNDIEDYLFDPEPRNRMLGLWAMQETERVDLCPQAHRLAFDAHPQVSELSRQVETRLEKMQEARESLMITLVQLAQVAEPVIRELNNPITTAALKPTRDDLIKLFDPALVDALIPEIEDAFRRPLLANPGIDYPNLTVSAVNGGLLRWSNEFSRKFPQGYRNISGWMQPQHIWLSWSWHNNEGGAVNYDGLVWVNQRWVWIPKVFRMVSNAIRASANANKGTTPYGNAPTTLQ